MRAVSHLLIAFLLPATMTVRAQAYDLLVKNGHLIDAKNKIDGVMDVAVKDGKVAKVARNIPAGEAKNTIGVLMARSYQKLSGSQADWLLATFRPALGMG